MSKKTMKILTFIATVLLVISMGVSIVYGASGSTFRPENVETDISGTDGIQKVGSKIMGIVQVVGTITSVVILVVLGIKYMMGSAEEKAEYKKTMIPYVIGAILIFAATNIAGVIAKFADTI